MDKRRPEARHVLTAPVTFPNAAAANRLASLVGLERHIDGLTGHLRILFDPSLVDQWVECNYRRAPGVVSLLKDAVPLILFDGDVGTGKTVLAEVIGQAVATDGSYGVHMVKMSTQVRGTGYVGEMGSLLACAFDQVQHLAERKGEPVILILDEADSLLTSRASDQHHHEDKSGVNTILQHLDDFRSSNFQIAVIAITNRIAVIDPAIRRRATSSFTFERPDEAQRRDLLIQLFRPALSSPQIERLLVSSGPRPGGRRGVHLPLTFSDIVLRFAIPEVRKAVRSGRPLDFERLVSAFGELNPSPRMDPSSSAHSPR